MKPNRILLRLILGLCVNGALIWGQETRAILSGTVTDPQSAVVPAAKVEIRNVVTTVQTNDAGVYTAPPVNPGKYLVTVTATGFKVEVENEVELRSADRKR